MSLGAVGGVPKAENTGDAARINTFRFGSERTGSVRRKAIACRRHGIAGRRLAERARALLHAKPSDLRGMSGCQGMNQSRLLAVLLAFWMWG